MLTVLRCLEASGLPDNVTLCACESKLLCHVESSGADDSVLRGLLGRDAKSDIRSVHEEYRNMFKSSYFDEVELPLLAEINRWHVMASSSTAICQFGPCSCKLS
jgi:hypothetical protein